MQTAISKPTTDDLDQIHSILQQWNTLEYAQKYLDRVKAEIDGESEHDRQFWIIRRTDGEQVLGLCGLSNCQPKLKPFITQSKPKEVRAVYLDGRYRGHGLGRKLLEFIQLVALKRGVNQLLLVSGQRYQATAYGFYEAMGFKIVGFVPGGKENKRLAVFSKLV